jgi:hypothetical protein
MLDARRQTPAARYSDFVNMVIDALLNVLSFRSDANGGECPLLSGT